MVVPFPAGAARPLLPPDAGGIGVPPRVEAPAPGPAGERFAYVQHVSFHPGLLCRAEEEIVPASARIACEPRLSVDHRLPSLAATIFRVRDRDALGPPGEDPSLRVEYPGRSFEADRDRFPELGGVWHVTHHPFHEEHVGGHVRFFRPTWSADGERVAFSDGLEILVWDPESGETTSIPGTGDGISPAWSPDGARIAFTRLVHGPEEFRFCPHLPPDAPGFGDRPLCLEARRSWPIERRVVTVIGVDGGGATEVAEGSEPAWSPDGARLYFRREDRIWSVPAAGGAAEAVPGTEGGREPDVSPDGRHLVFARRVGPASLSPVHDLWIVDLGS